MKVVAKFNADYEVKADDGCTASWKSGDIISIGSTEGHQVDYVRKGIIFQMAQEDHFHIIPGSCLSFFLDDGETMFPINQDKVLR